MSVKRALIVDDSKTAQVRLKKMLQKYNLEIDMAGSAEEALGYLSYRIPAVIFMDHLMQGMDGFEALKIIKSNPDTAMIPIIMYTSKSGDVYVSQARALGAIDVLSKDVIEPANIENVLRVINVLPRVSAAAIEDTDRIETVTAVADVREPAAEPVSVDEMPVMRPAVAAQPDPIPQSSELESIRQQVARLMEINISKIRHELANQNRLLFKRMVREFKEVKALQESANTHSGSYPMIVEAAAPPAERGWRAMLLEMIVLFGVAFIAFQVVGIGRQQHHSREQIETIQRTVDQQLLLVQEYQTPQAVDPVLEQSQHELLGALQWGMNLRNQFNYAEQALGDERLAVIQELVARLYEAQFAGVIRLSVNFGDFCLKSSDRGELIMPPADTPLNECEFLSQHVKTFPLQDQLSVSFVNFLVSSPLLADEGVQIGMESNGFSRPRYNYPDPSVRAGEWNRVAGLNNRVEISILPNGQPL